MIGAIMKPKSFTQQTLELLERDFRVVVWRQNTGRRGRVSYGKAGSGDITGIVFKTGQRLEVECKEGNDKQSEVQKEFENMIKGCGGIYILNDDLKTLPAKLDKALKKT